MGATYFFSFLWALVMVWFSQAVDQLVESLVKLDEIPLRKLDPLISRCPRIPSPSQKFSEEFQQKRFSHDFNSERRRTAILALCDYIILSKSNLSATLINDYILLFLKKLTSQEKVEDLGTFPANFISKLGQMED